MTVEAVLFDLAGGLIDFEPVCEEVRRAFVTEHDGRWQPDSHEQMMGMRRPSGRGTWATERSAAATSARSP